ncbi:MAG TPA: DinB family protein [Chloroflexota bacterium]|nr:DinB family protein [Chloroflexota bacterium]
MKQQLISAVQSERQAVFTALEGIDDATLTMAPVCGTWTAKEVLAHLAAVDTAVLGVLRQARAGDAVTWAWDSATDGDSWNQSEVDRRRHRSIAQVREEIAETHRTILAEVESWPAESGPFGPDSWDAEKSPIGWLPAHDREHTALLLKLRGG